MSTNQDSGISINDIALAVSAIEVATSRGAFRAEELSKIGQLYDRFSALVKTAREAEQKKEGV